MTQARAPRKIYVAIPHEEWGLLTDRLAHLEGVNKAIYIALGVIATLTAASVSLSALAASAVLGS